MQKFASTFIIFVLCIIIIAHSHFLQKTRDGKFFGYFRSTSQKNLPIVLTSYMKRQNIHSHLYKMPNYVVDFLKFDKDFAPAYRSGKFVIIIFPNYKTPNKQILSGFYSKLNSLYNANKEHFVLLKRNEISTPHYILSFDQAGYKDLREYCNSFCLINPKDKTMFTFSRYTDSEIEALEVLIQQYSFLIK